MKRIVVNVSTGQYVAGAERLRSTVERHGAGAECDLYINRLPAGCPPHSVSPYAFKPFAIREAIDIDEACSVLWIDSSIYPIRNMKPLWDKIEADGYYLCNNGFSNATWTADSAYADLDISREDNQKVKHCVAGVIGLNSQFAVAIDFLNEFLRLSRTAAFRGPTWNSNSSIASDRRNPGAAPCGPPEVRGHRHDQSSASVIAWKLGMELTDAPAYFAYKVADQPPDPRTILYAVGAVSEIESF